MRIRFFVYFLFIIIVYVILFLGIFDYKLILLLGDYTQFFMSTLLGLLAIIFSFRYDQDYNGNILKLKERQTHYLQLVCVLFLLTILMEFVTNCTFENKYLYVILYVFESIYIYIFIDLFMYVYREIKNGTR